MELSEEKEREGSVNRKNPRNSKPVDPGQCNWEADVYGEVVQVH
jgi:hypothetical protein